LCQGTLTCTFTSLEPKKLSPSIENNLNKFEDIFPKECVIKLLPFTVIEHQIDLVSEASLPNRPTYMTNLKKLKR